MDSKTTVAASRTMAARVATTIRGNFALAFRRGARRSPGPMLPQAFVWGIVAAALVGALFAVAFLDNAAAMARGDVPDVILRVSMAITRLGKSDWILVPSGVALIALTFVNTKALSRRALMLMFRWNVVLSFIFVGVGLPSLIATLVKRIIGRPRPRLFNEFGLFDLHPFSADASFASFPSGHATTIGAMAVVMALLVPRLRYVFLAAGVLIGLSRVGVGAHHPSDVVVGLLFGGGTAFFVAKWFAAHGLLFLDTPGTIRTVVRPAFRLRWPFGWGKHH